MDKGSGALRGGEGDMLIYRSRGGQAHLEEVRGGGGGGGGGGRLI